jgi:nicotinate-nucleotide adenylyltransferase
MPERVGLLGGTFDPVHNAHLALAHAALDALALDAVRWVPAGQPWQKDGAVTAAEHREAMVRLAIAGEPRFEVDRIELDRTGPSYTLDTVLALRAREPGTRWVLLIGQDQHARLHTWARWQELLTLVDLAVAGRPGTPPAVDAQVLRHPFQVVPLPLLDVSSSDIRQRVAQHQDISALVPSEVARYIGSHGLYADTASPARTSTGA